MQRTKWLEIFVVVAILVVVVALAAPKLKSLRAAPECLAGPGEKCPDEQTIRIGEKLTELQSELSTPELQEKVASLNGYQQMLKAQSPGPAWSYDLKKKKWVEASAPTPPAAAAPVPEKTLPKK